MAEFQPIIDAISGLLERINTTPSVPVKNYQFDIFDEKKESFSQYKERLENFFILQNIDVTKDTTAVLRGRILVNSIGTYYYQLLSGLIAPESPIGKSYSDLITLLEAHLCPPPNVQTERHKFLSRTQKPDESIGTYVASLKALTSKCQFECAECRHSVAPLFLCAQFVRGIHSSYIRERLLGESDLTDKKAIEIALAAEASRQDSQFLSNQSKPAESQVNSVKTNSKNQKQNFKPNTSRDGSKPTSNTGKNQPGKSKKKTSEVGNHRSKKTLVRDLGLSDLCLFCGYNNHKTDECKARDRLQCSGCNKAGHVVKVCISTLLKNRSVKSIQSASAEDDEYKNHLRLSINHINAVNENSAKFYADIKVNNVPCMFEVDSGSPFSLMSEEKFKKLKLPVPIVYERKALNAYTQDSFSSFGYVELSLEFNGVRSTGILYLIHEPFDTIAGSDWIRRLRIDILKLTSQQKSIPAEASVKNIALPQYITEKFSDVIANSIGQIPDYQVSFELDGKEEKPVFLKPRPIPIALLPRVNQELDYLIKNGVLEKTDYSQWGTPLVVVPKPNGKIRICGDYKATLNPQLLSSRYPIPRIFDIMNDVKPGYYFCILDIRHAYLHLNLDERSSKMATLSTHRGPFIAKRLY